MLGRLGFWLRILGYDAVSDPGDASDRVLAERAHASGRILLTRDRGMPQQPASVLRVESSDPLEQLAEVVQALALDWTSHRFTRCPDCNVALLDAGTAEVPPGHPDAAPARTQACPACKRVYWDGTHTREMRRRLQAALGGSQ